MAVYNVVESLSEKLKSTKSKRINFFSNESLFINNAKGWGMALFMYNFLKNSSLLYTPLNRNTTEKLLKNFNKNNNQEFTLKTFIDNNKIRFLGGYAEIPRGLRSALYRIENYPEIKNELLFLNELYNYKYRSDNYKKNVHWISIVQLERILKSHSFVFGDNFNLDDLLENNILVKKKLKKTDGYLLNIINGETFSFISTILDELLALFWRDSLKENKLTDQEKLCNLTEFSYFFQFDFYKIPEYLTSEENIRFFDAIIGFIENEKDLTTWINEIEKYKLEVENFKTASFRSLPKGIPETPFEAYEFYNRLEEVHNNILFSDVRKLLRCLLGIVSQYDNKDFVIGGSNSRLLKLFQLSLEKPYIAWFISFDSYFVRPENIAYLLDNILTLPLGLYLFTKIRLDNVKFYNEVNHDSLRQQEEYRNLLWKEVLIIFNNTLNNDPDNNKRANIVYKILYKLLIEEIRLKNNYNNLNRDILIEKLGQRIDLFKVNIERFISKKRINEELIKEVILFITKNKTDTIQNQFGGIPYQHFNMLFWIWQMSGSIDVKIKQEITDIILDYYLDQMQSKTYYIETGKENPVKWYKDIDFIKEFDWFAFFMFLPKESKRNIFLKSAHFKVELKELYPLIRTKEKGSSDAPANSDTGRSNIKDTYIYKIRNHLKILLIIYTKINIEDNFKNNIENEILDIVASYTQDKLEIGKVDIFSNFYERSTYGFRWDLLTELCEALNKFEVGIKNKIIDLMINNANDLIRIATLHDSLKSPADKEKVLSILSIENLKIFLNTHHTSLYDIRQLLISIANSGLIDQTEELLEHFKELKFQYDAKTEWEELKFRLKLHILYLKYKNNKDNTYITEIKRLSLPKEALKSSLQRDKLQKELENKRKFYLGAISWEKDPKEALIIFDTLFKDTNGQYDMAVNKFAVMTEIGEREKIASDRKKIFRKAINFWDSYFKNLNDVNEDFITKVNKLICYHNLEKYYEFDVTFRDMNYWEKYSPETMDVLVNNYIVREKNKEAVILLDKARKYHEI